MEELSVEPPTSQSNGDGDEADHLGFETVTALSLYVIFSNLINEKGKYERNKGTRPMLKKDRRRETAMSGMKANTCEIREDREILIWHAGGAEARLRPLMDSCQIQTIYLPCRTSSCRSITGCLSHLCAECGLLPALRQASLVLRQLMSQKRC